MMCWDAAKIVGLIFHIKLSDDLPKPPSAEGHFTHKANEKMLTTCRNLKSSYASKNFHELYQTNVKVNKRKKYILDKEQHTTY